MKLKLKPFTCACLLLTLLGCGSKRSPFLSDCPGLKRGEVQRMFHASDAFTIGHLARVHIEPVDVSRIADQPKWQPIAADQLKTQIASALRVTPQAGLADNPHNCTSRLAVIITRLEPGSRGGRILAGELGVGNARVEIEGKWLDPATNQPLACFADRSSDSGVAGFRDIAHDASAHLLRGLFTKLADRILKQVTHDFKYRRRER